MAEPSPAAPGVPDRAGAGRSASLRGCAPLGVRPPERLPRTMGPARRAAPALAAAAVAVLLAAGGCAPAAHGTTSGQQTAAASMLGPGPGATTGPAPDVGAGWVGRENGRTGSAAWRIKGAAVASDTQLAGYADRVSIRPGEPLHLYVTTTARSYTVRVFRLGWYGGDRARLIWTSPLMPGSVQRAPSIDARRTVTAHWRRSATLDTRTWPEGTYLLKLTDNRGLGKFIPVTVRSSGVRGRLVLVNAVTTYQAYNAWGGYSLYGGPGNNFGTRANAVSFDRPYDDNGARIVTNYEQSLIAEAERANLPLAYLTSVDLEHGTHVLDGARGLVSLGHDEYWTTAMRQRVTAARDRGVNLAFMGANSVYWRIRLERGALGPDRVVVGYKSAALDPLKRSANTTAMWRQSPQGKPENSLVGMLYECFPARGALVVHDPGSFLFRGTGARRGTTYPGLVGTEIDRAYPVAGTPRNLQVLAHSPVLCGPGRRTWSDVTYYSTRSGAGVFAVGTMLWNKGLAGTNTTYGITQRSVTFARTVTRNLFSAMAAGPVGARFPAHGNLAALHVPSRTSTGTGGPLGH
jgi:hypothetical protein